MKRRIYFIIIIVIFFLLFFTTCKQSSTDTIRIGFFPNLIHSQAIYGYANGDFERAFGEQYNVKWQCFNAGPAEIEAIFAGEVDIGYIGPIPAINGYIKSGGDVKIIAGATINGAMLVTKKNLNINNIKELAGCIIAIPQFGNTQHLCLLNLLSSNGLSTVGRGGNIKIVECSNADIKILMDKGEIDAALIPEPWATQLSNEIGANILLDSNDMWENGGYSTAVVIVNTDFYKKNKDIVEIFLETHIDITEYINNNSADAMIKINNKIEELTGSKLDADVLQSSFSNMLVTYDPNEVSINKFIELYRREGFIKDIINKNNFYDFDVLNSILKKKNLSEISVVS